MSKVGRPKKASVDSRAPGISVRLTPSEECAIRDAVKRSGLRKSEWARKSLLHVANRDIRIT